MLLVGKPVKESVVDQEHAHHMQEERQRTGNWGSGQARTIASQPNRQLQVGEYRRQSVALGNQRTLTLNER